MVIGPFGVGCLTRRGGPPRPSTASRLRVASTSTSGRRIQRYRLRQQAAPDESQDPSRRLVEPLCVIDDAQQRLLLGRFRHPAERAEGDHEPVGAISRGKPERHAESAPLRLGSSSVLPIPGSPRTTRTAL